MQAEEGDAAPRRYQKLEEWVMQACRDKIRPELIPRFEVVRDVEPGRDVAEIRIDRGWGVHHVWHNQHRTYFVRVGSSSREASPEELGRLFQQRGAFRLELRPVSGTSIRDLDRRRLREYFEQVREQEAPASAPSEEWHKKTEDWAKNEDERYWKALVEDREREWREARESEWTRLLVNTEFLDENDPQPATVAGLLLVGANPNRFLPQAGIDAVAYFGPEKDFEAKERRKLRGPLVRLQGGDGALLEPGLPEQAVEFVRRNIDTVILGGRHTQAGAVGLSGGGGSRGDRQRHRPSRLPAFGFGYRARHLFGSTGNRIARPTGERHHPRTDAVRMPERPERASERRHARLRLHGAHGDGGAPDDHPGDARAQRHRDGSRRRWRALHRPAVERTARMKRLLARRPVLRTRALSGTQPAFVDPARA